MRKGTARVLGCLGAIFGLVSAALWLLSANAQLFGLDPQQAHVSGMWNAQSAQFNYWAAALTAAAAGCSGLAVAIDK